MQKTTLESYNNQFAEHLSRIGNPQTNALIRARLIEEASTQLSKKELAYVLGKSPSYLSNHLRLLKLPEIIQDALLSNIISEGHARALSFLLDHQEILKAYESILKHNWSVRETEREVGQRRHDKREYGKVSTHIVDLAKKTSSALQVPVQVRRSRRGVVITITFEHTVAAMRKLMGLLGKLARTDSK